MGSITTRTQSDTNIVHGENGVWGWAVPQDRDWMHVHAENAEGEVMDFYVPTQNYVRFFPNDTTLGTPQVNHVSFAMTSTDSISYDTLSGVVHLVTTEEIYLDSYNQYQGYDTLVHTEGYATCFGLRIPFPPTNAAISWKSVMTAEDGSDGEWDYTLATTNYDVTFYGGTSVMQAYHTLKREAGHDVFVRKVLVNSGWTPTHFNAWGLPDQGTAWGDIADEYSESGIGTPTHYETSTVCPISVPADTSLIAQDFNVSWATAQLGTPVTVGTTTDGYFQITNWRRTYAVGANTPSFTRVFGLQYPKVVWTDGTWTFDINVPEWSNFSESHSLTDATPVTGYDRKLATNYMSVSLGSYSGQIPAKTYIKVEAENPGPGPDDPVTIVDSTLINPQLLYQDPTHGISKVTKRYTYSDGHTVDVDIVSYPENGYECLSSGVFYGPLTITGIDWGTPTFISSRTSGNIRYDKYEVTGMISYGVGIHKDFRAWVEWPVYVPMGYSMMHGEYSFAVSALEFVQSLGQTTTQNTTYNKGLYSQGFTGTLYNHTNQYGCDIEVWEQDYIPKEAPTCFGGVVNMTFSMAEPAQGQTMVECKVVEFEHGWAIICQGQTNFYAKAGDNACSGYQTLPATNSSGATINYQSGIKVNGTWYPATVTPTGNWQSWTYGCRINGQLYTLTIAKSDAIINGVGGNGLYKPIPDAQAFSMSGPVGILQYSHNNLTDNMNATFMFW